MSDSLDSHFFVIFDEFGAISPIDPTSFDNSSVEKWMADETSDSCMLCNTDFHPMVRRRHHCRYCGLLFCGSCTSNRTMVNDSVVRVCDACAVILIPPSPSYKYWGLKKWCADHECSEIFQDSPKSAGIRYLCSTLESECVVAHTNAARTLFKLYRCHAPVMIANGVPKTLLKHSVSCNCPNAGLTLSLFVMLYNADSEGCQIDFAADFADLDCVKMVRESDLDMKRAASRLLYVLCSKKVIEVPDISELVAANDDKWVLAFLIATLSLKYPIADFKTIQNEEFGEHLENAEKLAPLLLGQFEKSKGSVASRYFASIVLERMSHCKPEIELIAKSDLEQLVQTLVSNAPRNETDSRPETQMAIYLCSILLNVWRHYAESREENCSVLFSQVLIPLFDVMGVSGNGNTSNLGIIKMMFLEMLRHIASFDALRTSVSSEQMLSILNELSQRSDGLADEAKATVSVLSA